MTELRQLPEAYVSVIKMKCRGLEVDLTMARVVGNNTVPETDTFLLKDDITKGHGSSVCPKPQRLSSSLPCVLHLVFVSPLIYISYITLHKRSEYQATIEI